MNFKDFLINEQKSYLAERLGDVLTVVHELLKGGKQISARLRVEHAEGAANQIRKILHSTWSKSETKYLKVLQKCGVALLRTIKRKGDLEETLNSVRSELEQLLEKLGQPVNSLGSDG